MSDTSDKPRFINASRRGFLQGAAVASGAAAAGGAAAATLTDDVDDHAVPEVKPNKGYELTDHIRKYYKRARF